MVSNPQVWQRIEDYELDAPDAEFDFSARLVRDNGWSQHDAYLAIEEYKRFIYLCAITKRQLTPSMDVDLVWHQHLTYTRDYWGPFVKAVSKKIHHGPSSGGDAEAQRYADNYAATLALYLQEFEAAPPIDIWPDENSKVVPTKNFRRVNLASHIVLPKLFAGVIVAAVLAVWLWKIEFDQGGMGLLQLVIGVVVACLIFYIFLIPKRWRETPKNASNTGHGDDGGGCAGGCGGD